MSNPREDTNLTQPAARLARAAPQEWREFLDGFRKFAESQRDLLVMASLDELQRTQGRAQIANATWALLEDAVKAADRMAARPPK